jgi:hypothetical protein
MAEKRKNIFDKTIHIKVKTLVITVVAIVILTVVSLPALGFIQLLFVSSGVTQPNNAEMKARPIDFVLKSHGATEVCKYGDNGRGIDSSKPPQFQIGYRVKNTEVLTDEIIGYAKRSGFDLVATYGTSVHDEPIQLRSIIIENTRPDSKAEHGLYRSHKMEVTIYRKGSADIRCGDQHVREDVKDGQAIVTVDVLLDESTDAPSTGSSDEVKNIDYDFDGLDKNEYRWSQS